MLALAKRRRTSRPLAIPSGDRPAPAQARFGEGTFNGPTDVGWDAADNIYVSDGYGNTRIHRFDDSGNALRG